MTAADGLDWDNFTDVFQDREGLLWFSLWNEGVSCCDPHAIHRSGAELDLRDLCEDSGETIWLGGASGLVALERTDLDIAPVEETTEFDQIWTLCPDPDGGLWLGGTKGLAHWDGRRLRVLGPEEGFDGIYVTALLYDPEQGLLLGHGDQKWTELCLSRYDGHTFHTLLRQRRTFPFSCINGLVIARDRQLWFALGAPEPKATPSANAASAVWKRTAASLPISWEPDAWVKRMVWSTAGWKA